MTPGDRRRASGRGSEGIWKTRSRRVASAAAKASSTIPAPTLAVFNLSSCFPLDLLPCATATGTMKRPVHSEKAPKPIGPYSQAVEAGDYVFCSGQIGLDPKTGELVDGVVAQTNRALTNLKEVLAKVGLTLEDVVKTTVFMADLAEFSKMNEEYVKHFPSVPPARSTVQAAALPRGSRVEIEAIAVKRSS